MKRFILSIFILWSATPYVTAQNKGNCRGPLYPVEVNTDIDLKDLVQKFIAKVLKVVTNNDPYQIQELDFDYDGYGIKSTGYLKNFILSFMSTAHITNLIVDNISATLEFGFDLSLEQIQALGPYNLNVTVLTMLNLNGHGDLGILLRGVTLTLRTNLKATNNQILQFTGLKMGLRLGGSKIELQNLMNNYNLGVFASKVLSDRLPDTVNMNPGVFSAMSLGLRAILNVELCNNAVTIAKTIDVMQHFIM